MLQDKTQESKIEQAAANMSQASGSMDMFSEATGYGQLPDDSKGRKTILITNDDGYLAGGINRMIESLRDLARLVVLAPDSPRSGFSASFTCTHPITLRRVSDDGDVLVYACSGTPVDCVKLALHRFFSGKYPDLIVSGINHGGNDSICIMYSGTMGAVLEGCVVGIPAVGFSLLDHRKTADFTNACIYVHDIVKAVLEHPMEKGVSLNVNIPVGEIKGVRVCRQAQGLWEKEFHFLNGDENEGEAVFQVTGEYRNLEEDATDTDRYWLERQYISVVPVEVDYTHHEKLDGFRYLERVESKG